MLTRMVPLLLSLAAASPASSPIAIVGVTVIDVETGRRLPGSVVVVRDGVVESVGRKVQVPRGARRVNGRNRFLIPGLWDMHVHTMPQPSRPRALTTFLPLFVANGVTGVRDMGSVRGAVTASRARVARQGLVSPRIVAAGPLLDGVRPQWPQLSIPVNGREDAAAAVDAAVADGADFLKVYSGLSRDAFLGLAEVGRRRGLALAGHVPGALTAAEVSDAGQRSIEHLGEIQMACSGQVDAIRAELAAVDNDPAASAATRMAARRGARDKAARTLDPERCRDLLARLVRNGTWVVPTLTVAHNALDPSRATDPRLRYFEPETLAAWRGDGRRPAATDASPLAGLRESGALDLVRRLNEAHVGLLAGTDLTNFYTMPGFDLHLELALLVEAGLTPLQALQAATLQPARFLGLDRELGTVAAGRRADLVLLDADPLADIRNTSRIAAVVRAGHLYNRAALDALLAGVARAVVESR